MRRAVPDLGGCVPGHSKLPLDYRTLVSFQKMALPLNYRRQNWLAFRDGLGFVCWHLQFIFLLVREMKQMRQQNHRQGNGINNVSVELLCAWLTLTFNAFFAASAPDRLSKVTNPTGWKTKARRIKTKTYTLQNQTVEKLLENCQGRTFPNSQNWLLGISQWCVKWEKSILAFLDIDGKLLTCFDVNLISDPS